MRQTLPQQYSSRLWRAIVEFDLLAPGDRILIGLSGGKDSSFLTYALANLRRYSPIPFSLAALTIDPMYTDDFPLAQLADFCRSLDVPFYSERVDIARAVRTSDRGPCFTCAFFRRGAMNRFARAHGFNKVALAHHQDDVVETFVMGLLYSGQLRTFAPKTYLDRTGLEVIRPLVYFREKHIREAVRRLGLSPIASPCPLDGKTKRQEVKDLLAWLGRGNKFVFTNLAAAMRQGAPMELWPPVPSRQELAAKYTRLFGKKMPVPQDGQP